MTLATVDILGLDSMPGDFTAAFKDEKGNDQIGYMIPYGAASVDVLANGEKYQLKSGSTVEIEIPLPKHLEGSKFIPKTIPFLEYNKEKGIWEKIGEGIFNENTQVYTATTTQFSSFNMDVLKTNQACLVIDGTGIKKDYKLQVDFVYNAGDWIRYTYPSANEIYALHNLPPNIEYTLTAFKTDLNYPLMIGTPATCTPGPQDPGPNIPDSGCNFTFPACKHLPPESKPVILSAERPLPPTDLTAPEEQIGCNYINLYWDGSANGPEEGYIIKVYQNGGILLSEHRASHTDTTLRVEGLEPSTTYYFHIHQYDEYAEEDSEPYPNPLLDPPLTVTTSASQTFSIINAICGQQITQVYFNSGTKAQTLPNGGIGYGDTHGFSVCRIPHRIQLETDVDSYDFRNNSKDSIYVGSLVEQVKRLNSGPVWKYRDAVGAFHTLVFELEGTFKYLKNDAEIDCGTYQEDNQDCPGRIITFTMKFTNLDDPPLCEYIFSTDRIEITAFPGTPSFDAEFERVELP